jgi:hypothetical protein
MVKIAFFVPEDHKEVVKAAMFAAGAGNIGNYDQCCWEVEGVGQFRPLDCADPFLGAVGALERIKEFKVEMVCTDDTVSSVVQALKQAHPYEEPAYDVVVLLES